MENNYQSLMDELFGSNYKHRTLRTVFDPYSNEWHETNIVEKKLILKKILASKKITLNELIRSYKLYHLYEATYIKNVAESVEDSLIILLEDSIQK